MPEPLYRLGRGMLLAGAALGGALAAGLLVSPAPAALPPSGGEGARPARLAHRSTLPLPQAIGGWTRADTVRLVRPDGLYDYMDGGADLFLGYRLRHLEVCEYDHPSADPILVESFFMETSDDAFGLLSLDWSGRPVEPPESTVARALFEGGMLRLWSDDLFVRILAYRETEASREAVTGLARAIRAGRATPAPPALTLSFPRLIASRYRLLPPVPAFFRGHVALNAIFPLSGQDILGLDPACEGAVGLFRPAGGDSTVAPVCLILLRYEDQIRSIQGMRHFRRSYLGQTIQADIALKRPPEKEQGGSALQGSWTGYFRTGRNLALVLAAPEEKIGLRFLSEAEAALGRLGPH